MIFFSIFFRFFLLSGFFAPFFLFENVASKFYIASKILTASIH